jgi:hypothetical protein
MPNFGMYNKLLSVYPTPEEENDEAYAQSIVGAVTSLDILPPGSLLEEDSLVINRWNLARGTYGAFEHEAPHNIIHGMTSGTMFTRRCVIRGHASVFGVEFNDLDDVMAAELVRVGHDAAVSFVNCIFRRNPASLTNIIYVENVSGAIGSNAGTAVFVGCTFLNGGVTTINNVSGTALLVQTVGCVNGTGNATFGANITETGTIHAET